MERDTGFWQSLEEYLRKVVGRSPLPALLRKALQAGLPWQWIGIGLVVIAILTSLLNVKNSLVGAKDTKEAIGMAVGRGDYETADRLYKQNLGSRNQNLVLGSESELEDKVYPERVVERRISELEEKLKVYPGNREIYQELANLYGQLDNQEKSTEYLEKERVLDPNEVEF